MGVGVGILCLKLNASGMVSTTEKVPVMNTNREAMRKTTIMNSHSHADHVVDDVVGFVDMLSQLLLLLPAMVAAVVAVKNLNLVLRRMLHAKL